MDGAWREGPQVMKVRGRYVEFLVQKAFEGRTNNVIPDVFPLIQGRGYGKISKYIVSRV